MTKFWHKNKLGHTQRNGGIVVSAAIRASAKLVIGILIFIGLPLAGWGLRDVPGFIRNPARLGYIILLVLLQLFVVIRFPEAGSSRGREQAGSHDRLILFLLQMIPLMIVVAAPYTDRRDIAVFSDIGIIRYTGLLLLILGFIGMHWAEASLGKQFSVYVTIQDDHKLITDGPFRYLRHPRYLGIIVFIVGVSLVFRSWPALILAAVLLLVLLLRIHGEEALLHKTFGREWEEYTKRSWRLIPFVF